MRQLKEQKHGDHNLPEKGKAMEFKEKTMDENADNQEAVRILDEFVEADEKFILLSSKNANLDWGFAYPDIAETEEKVSYITAFYDYGAAAAYVDELGLDMIGDTYPFYATRKNGENAREFLLSSLCGVDGVAILETPQHGYLYHLPWVVNKMDPIVQRKYDDDFLLNARLHRLPVYGYPYTEEEQEEEREERKDG